MATSSLGRLTLDLLARTGGFTGPLERARRQTRRQMRDIQKSAKFAAAGITAVTAAAAAGATGLYIYTKAGMDAIDADAKLAAKLDTNIGSLRGVRQAASDAGISHGLLESAMKSYTKRLGDAVNKTGEAQKAYNKLGLDAGKLAKIPLPEQLAKISERIGQLDTAAERASIADKLMSGGRDMVALFGSGGDAIRDAAQEIKDFNQDISGVDAAAIEAANDAMSRVGRTAQTVQETLAVEMAPMLLVLTERFNDMAREAGGFGEYVEQGVGRALNAIGWLLDGYHDWAVWDQKIILKTTEMDLAFAKFAKSAWGHVSAFLDKWVSGLNNIIDGINSIPGMDDIELIAKFGDSDFVAGFDEQLSKALGKRNLAAIDLSNLIERGSYRAVFDEFLDDVDARTQHIANVAKGNLKPLNDWFLKAPPAPLGGGGDSDESSSSASSNKAAREAARAAEQQQRALQSLMDTLYPYEAAQQQARQEQLLLQTAFTDGTIGIERYLDAFQRLETSKKNSGSWQDVYDSIGRVNEQLDNSNTFAEKFGGTMSSALEDAIVDFESFGDVATGVLEDIQRMLVRQSITDPLANAIGGADWGGMIGGLFSGGSGGGAGSFSGSTGGLYSAVGQAHSGIDRVPKSGTWNLEKGERVVTADTSTKLDATLNAVARSGTGGNTTVQVIDQRSGGEKAEVQETRGADGMRRIRVMIRDEQKAAMSDGSMDSTMSRYYGVRRRSL